ncbi:MBG domain-containing protein [Pleomorphomonas sp. JP5]|uniref:MBG domain-containing protein n=1 Tax=Pleomorphomonas sp. JP5 TaxID=2942998 RepID=UPI0020444DBB|nr:MBG domain-containing protein [Pleomorphomonas sp. JP5]
MPAQVLAGAVLPTGAHVVTGSATVAAGSDGLVINQTSSAAIVNWNTFSIGAGGSVLFNNGSGSTLSRVTGNVTSQIDGQLSATGTLYLVNPAGVVVGPGGKVTTGGSFIASTHDITDQDYLDGGAATFSGNSTASVVNNGTIASANGDVALIARRVENTGAISASNGTAALAAGYDVLMSDSSGENGKFAVRVGGSDTAAVNSGTVKAAEIEMRANGGNVYALAGNTESVIKATGVSSSGGRIFLTAGDSGTVKSTAHIVARAPKVTVLPLPRPADLDGGKVVVTGGTVDLSGTVDASAEGEGNSGGSIIAIASGQGIYSGDLLAQGGTGGAGGTVETSGHSVDFTGISVNTSAVGGTTGNWLVDPEDLTVDAASAATISSNLATTSVTLQTTSTTASGTGVVTAGGNGDITIASAISWSSGNRLTLDAYNNIAIDAAITATSGGLTLTAGNAISASAGISVGSYIQTAGAFSQIAATLPTFSATDFDIQGGSFLRVTGGDGTSATPYLISDVYGLQGVGSSSTYRAANWALANDIDASGTASWHSGAGFVPIGNANAFTGTFNGQDHTITGLTIDRPTTSYVGLFGKVGTSATSPSTTWVQHLGLIDVDITGLGTVGGIAGALSFAQLMNDYVTGTVTGDATIASGYVGGLVGAVDGGGVFASYSEANVSGGTSVGGLIGFAVSGVVQTSYASGNVSGTKYVGGLIGINRATLRNSYAIGDVSGTSNVGGLVGYNQLSGYIQYTYASGAVSGTSNVGGLVGANNNVVFDSYYDIDTTGQSVGIGSYTNAASYNVAVGLTTAQARTASSYSAFSFGNSGIWFMIDGQTRPFLRSEYSTTITNAHQLQLMALDLSADYTLATNIDASATSGSNASDMWSTKGFVPLGGTTTSFTGTFGGQGHTISGLTIVSTASNVGLFGSASGTIKNVGLLDVDVRNTNTNAGMIGSLVGVLNTGGLVTNSYATGSVSGTWQTGGLVGSVAGNATVTRSYAHVTVSGNGGLVGQLVGTISQSFATGDVTASAQNAVAGGLVGEIGYNGAVITQSYATGNVSATSGSGYAGGLVGWSLFAATIDQSYATGIPSGTFVGGIIGRGTAALTVTNSYWDKETTGITSGSYGTAKTTAELQGTLPSGFDGSVWKTGTGLYPYLSWAYSATPIAVTGTAYTAGGLTALTNATVSAVSNGSSIGSASTGANGYYYILTSSGALASTGVLTYLDGESTQGIAFKDSITPSSNQTGLNISSGVLSIQTQNNALSTTVAALQNTLGTYTDSDLGTISAIGSGITTSLGVALYAKGGTQYSLDGDLISSAGELNLQSVGSTFGISGSRALSASGNLTLASAISWSDGSTLSLLSSAGSISMQGVTGASGSLTLQAGNRVYAFGDIAVGTLTLSSGLWSQIGSALPALTVTDFRIASGASFVRALAGTGTSASPYQLFDAYGLQGMASTSLLFKNFVLANDIDASGTASWNSGAGFASIGSATIAFSGTLNGQSHTITGLTISRATTDNVGLFGVTLSTAAIRDVGLVGGSVTGQTNVGALVGQNAGTITDVYATADVNGTTSVGGLVGLDYGTIDGSHAAGAVQATTKAGGLVGYGMGNTIRDSYAEGNVTSTSGGYIGGLVGVSATSSTLTNVHASGNVSGTVYVGGLVGSNASAIIASYATGTVKGTGYVGGLVGGNFYAGTIGTSFATGAVGGAGSSNVGGLVGLNNGTVANAYATGSATSSFYVGGLVGQNNGAVSNAYATGAVTGSGFTGGLVGVNAGSGTVAGSFYDSSSTGQSDTGKGTGLTSAEMMDATSYAGWDLATNGGTSSVWRIYDGYTAPLLRTFLTATTVTASDVSKTYDGTTYAGGFTASYSDPSAVLFGTLGGNLASVKNAGTYAIGGLYSDQFGYDIAMSGSLTVNKASLTITANSASKTYDGLAYSGGNGVTYAGLVNGETASVLGGTLSYVGTSQGVVNAGSYTLTASGLTSGNYDISYVAGSLTVNKAALTITANSASKTYDGLAYSGGNGVTYAGLVNGETASVLGGTLFYDGTSQGAVNAGSYTLNASGLTSGNYDISYVTGALTVNKASLTVTANSASKTYDGLAYSGGNGVTYAGLVNGETASVLGGTLSYDGTADGAINAGSYTLTASGLTSGNYDISYVAGSLTVNKAALTITANSASKTYDGLAYSGGNGVTYAGLVNGETASVLGGTLFYDGTSQGAVNAGSYTLTASGLTSGNYDISYVAGALTVNKASLTVTANSASKTYDGLAYSGGNGVTYAGLVNGETASVLGGTLSYDGTSQGAVNAGSYTLTASGLTSGNYDISYVAGALTINPAALTLVIKPAAVSKTYGQLAALSAYSVLGTLQGGDAIGSVTLSSAGAAATANVGSYDITASNAVFSSGSASNYTITYQTLSNGLTVTPAVLTASLTGLVAKTYDGTASATLGSGNYTLSSLTVAGDLVSLVAPTSGSYDSADAGTGKTVSVSGLTLSGASAGNYILASDSISGTIGTVNKAALTITANSASKTYDGLTYSGGNGVTYAGLVNGETASVLGGTLAYGGTASYVAGALTVNKAALTVTANSASKTYDGLAYSGGNGVTYAGLVNGETASVLGGTLSYDGTSQGAVNAGSYTLTASGLTSGNYDISYVTGALTVNKAALTITASSASKTYDGLAYSGGNGVTYAGLVNGETASVLGGTLSYDGTSQGAVNAGSYTLTASGLTSGNYDISYVAGALTINPTAPIVGPFADVSLPDSHAFAQGRANPTSGTTLSFVMPGTSGQGRTVSESPTPEFASGSFAFDTYNMVTGAISSDATPEDATSQADVGGRTLIFAPGTFSILAVSAEEGDGQTSTASSLAEPVCTVGVAGAASAGVPYPCNVASDGG